jgi:hypothetical protein
LGIALAAACLAAVRAALVPRAGWRPLLPFLVAIAAIVAWMAGLRPSNDRQWQPDVARQPSAVIEGDRVTLRNVRSFVYRTETDFEPRWHDRTVDLRDLDTLDLIAVYWMGDAIAHTMLSFGFGGDQVVVSIETRKEVGEAYSALAGFFRRYELIYLLGDENDLIGVRTTHRRPPEDVYVYRVRIAPERLRALFLDYLRSINELVDRPAFYNTATTNCTTMIVPHVRAVAGEVPWSWKILLSGHFPELAYERGALDRSLDFPELRRRSLVNDRAVAAERDPAFSRLIRAGLPGT